jgi:hypothetical protein
MICASKQNIVFFVTYEFICNKFYVLERTGGLMDFVCFFFRSFPGSTNEMLLQKFNSVQKDNQFYEKPQRKESAFIIKHYAGKVKYQVSVIGNCSLNVC